MKNMFKVVVDYTPSQVDNAVIEEGVIAFNESILDERDKAFSIFLKDDLGKVFGGIQAFLGSESIYIEALWVERNLQKQGYGTQLLDAAEQEAVKNGCVFSGVDTFDFQSEGFYLKNGYKRVGELKNCWLGHSKIFLRKNLNLLDVRNQSKEAKGGPMNQEVLPCFSSLAKSIVVGSLYEHYKGFRYRIIGVARHSETLEELVVYQALYGEGGIWVRPLTMFLENIEINGQLQPRFKLVQ